MTESAQSQEIEDRHSIQVLVRIWSSSQSEDSIGDGGSVIRVRALAEDVLGANLNAKLDPSRDGSLYAWSFSHLGRALASARMLQEALCGFRTAASQKVAASIVLDRAATNGNSRTDRAPHELTSLLNIARPSQVLVTHAFHKGVESWEALSFQSFPSRSDVLEWMWADKGKLKELQSMHGLEPSILGSPSRTPPEKTVAAELEPFPVAPFAQHSSARSRSGRKGSWSVAIVGVALIAVAVPAFLIWQRLPTDHGYKPIVNAPRDSGVPDPELPVRTQILSKKPIIIIPEKPLEIKEPGFPSPSPKPGSSSHCPIAGDPAGVLNMAERNRSAGNYIDAERQYLEVLQCEPGNRVAHNGLARTRADLGH